MKPYYEHGGITIYHGDCRDVLPTLEHLSFAGLVFDPPYGISYDSGARREVGNARSIQNDADTAIRDWILDWYRDLHDDGPALAFGSWKRQRPTGTKGILVWDKGGALGMGDLSIPWKFDHEEIYVIGSGFEGARDSGSVLRCPPVQAIGRWHPHEKPVRLLSGLMLKLPVGAVLDPCCGCGSGLVAAKNLGRRAIGIEIEERYCEIAARRLAQETLFAPPPLCPIPLGTGPLIPPSDP